jgi:iodotyrosine deiodinase
MNKPGFKYLNYTVPVEEEIADRAASFRSLMSSRRSVRHFSDKWVHQSVIEDIIMTAASAPSGANKQPWTFCAVSDAEIKRQIRAAAEKEEYENYHGRMSDSWLEDLKHLDTDWHKEFLEKAPWLIVLFKRVYNIESDDTKTKNYYVNESVGIAAGMLITSIHNAGLVTLTHTPSPMNFLQTILGRPENEKPYLLLPVGYPAKNAEVPDLYKRIETEVICYY